MTAQGKTVEEMCRELGIAFRTLYNWWKTRPEFMQAIKEKRSMVDEMVEASLFQRAMGYTHPEVKHFAHEGVVTDERITTKHYPPDTAAAFIWLKNRRPEKWRDKTEVEHGMSKEMLELRAMKDEDLLKLTKIAIKELEKGSK